MDLDDSFTERLLQRNKERRQFITVKQNGSPGVVIKKRAALIDEQQIRNQESLEVSPKRSYDEDSEDSPKRQCLERCEGSPSRQWPPKQTLWEKENNPSRSGSEESYVPFKASRNERGLAALKNKDNSDSDVASSGLTSKAESGNSQTYLFSTNGSELCTGRKARLAHLAADINQWEDNLTKVASLSRPKPPSVDTPDSMKSTTSSSSTYAIKKSSPDSCIETATTLVSKPGLLSPSKFKRFENNNSRSVKNKLGAWDQAVKAALESDEVVKPIKKVLNENREFVQAEKPPMKIEDSSSKSVKNSLQQFRDKHVKEDLNRSFDPTDLPLSARRALFEQASRADASKPRDQSLETKLSVAQRAALFENASQKSLVSKPAPMHVVNKNLASPQASPQKPSRMANIDLKSSPLKSLATPEKTPKQENIRAFGSPTATASPIKKITADTQAVERMLLARVNSKVDVAQKCISEQEEVKNKNELVNYWEKISASSKSGNCNSEEEELPEKPDIPESDMYQSEDDQDGYESETESKYERESESDFNYKESESELNYRESESESNYRESEFNYNTEITETEYSEESDQETDSPSEAVFKSPKGFPIGSSHAPRSCVPEKTMSKVSNSWQADNYTDDTCDAMSLADRSSYAESTASTDIKSIGTHPSYSSSCSSVGSSYDPESSKESEENFIKTLPSGSHGESDSHTPLLYTVSFYRKQKQETRTPPMKSIVRREQVSTPPSANKEKQRESIQEEIKIYQEEILKQETIIGQTSQALNLCHATAEFSGSAEQVEGERLLLIATQKRQALLNEIQRLKTLGAKDEVVPDGMGTLTISDLQLPLKQEFLAAQLEGKINDAVHWFLCLIRHGGQVIVTQMMSTDEKVTNGALCFTNHIKLQNLPPDFSVVFEVYALQTKKESLTHEKKYHIKRDKNTSKGKKSDGKFLIPSISSPGGPHAVRSPSFGVIGFTRFNIQNCNKKCFTLDNVPFTSPLEGILRVRLHLHAEHKVMEKGFLTMFEDVSGFGYWHRRWCALNSQLLTYWKYPDDEYKKDPIGSIDLKQCITGYVKPVSRDVCARSHTFQLVTVRPQEKNDKNTLITHCANTITTTKHLLAADTKEERIVWCDKLNEALSNVRKWDPHALRPKETNL